MKLYVVLSICFIISINFLNFFLFVFPLCKSSLFSYFNFFLYLDSMCVCVWAVWPPALGLRERAMSLLGWSLWPPHADPRQLQGPPPGQNTRFPSQVLCIDQKTYSKWGWAPQTSPFQIQVRIKLMVSAGWWLVSPGKSPPSGLRRYQNNPPHGPPETAFTFQLKLS
jgi:hypothetical protein